MSLTPAVSAALSDAARALQRAADAWQPSDQAAWGQSKTLIDYAIGMSLDEAAAEIQGFVDEAEQP